MARYPLGGVHLLDATGWETLISARQIPGTITVFCRLYSDGVAVGGRTNTLGQTAVCER